MAEGSRVTAGDSVGRSDSGEVALSGAHMSHPLFRAGPQGHQQMLGIELRDRGQVRLFPIRTGCSLLRRVLAFLGRLAEFPLQQASNALGGCGTLGPQAVQLRLEHRWEAKSEFHRGSPPLSRNRACPRQVQQLYRQELIPCNPCRALLDKMPTTTNGELTRSMVQHGDSQHSSSAMPPLLLVVPTTTTNSVGIRQQNPTVPDSALRAFPVYSPTERGCVIQQRHPRITGE